MEHQLNSNEQNDFLMSERAKSIFDSTVKGLKKLKSYADIDAKLIQAYAIEMATFEEASIKVAQEGECIPAPSGYKMINPYYTIRKQSLKAAMDIAKLFGFTPIVRKSLGTKEAKETPEFNILGQRKMG